MKDPTRLLDSSAGEAERRLLRAGANEEPPSEALQRLAAKLGLNPSASGAPAANTSAAANSASATAAALAKLQLAPFALAVAGLALAAGIWIATRPSTATHSETGYASPPSAAPGAPPASPSPASTEAQLAPAQPAAAQAEPAPDATRQAPDAHATLAREIAVLDEVRRLLATGHARAALSALEGYEREFPSGALLPEASVLRIEAHQRAGERERARALAERFLADHPDSPHAARVRRLSGARTYAR